MANEVRIVNKFVEHANAGDTKAVQIRASKRFVDALRVTGAWRQAKKSADHLGKYADIPVVLLEHVRRDNVLIVVSEKRQRV